MTAYRSPYEAYPFLADAPEDLRCDFEILTDLIASLTGELAAACPQFGEELIKVCELVYHINPTLRTFFSITSEEIAWLKGRTEALQKEAAPKGTAFVLPAGTANACKAHVLRTQCKQLVRLIYRHMAAGHAAPDGLLDVCNLLSGYFFALALAINQQEKVQEMPFISRNYRG